MLFNETNTTSISIDGRRVRLARARPCPGHQRQSHGLDRSHWQSDDEISAALAKLDTALNIVRSQASDFGSNLIVLQTRQDFTKQSILTLNAGADLLTLADTSEEGANLLALQTRQQLSTQALVDGVADRPGCACASSANAAGPREPPGSSSSKEWTMALKVELKPNERIIIGNAVIRNGEQRTRFFIEGDAPILREKDILTPTTAEHAGEEGLSRACSSCTCRRPVRPQRDLLPAGARLSRRGAERHAADRRNQ